MDTLQRPCEPVKETWKPVATEPYGEQYEVSDRGNVRRIGKARPLRPGPTSRGYMSVQLYVPNASPKKSKSFTVHRLVAVAFLGPSDKPQVNHLDGDKRNNTLANLEWATQRENMQHAVRSGLHRAYGVRRYAKMTEAEAREAIRLSAEGVADKRLGKVFRVSESCVRQLRLGMTWASLERPAALAQRKRGVKSAAHTRRAAAVLQQFLNARKPQRRKAGTVPVQPCTSADLPESAA